MQILRKPVVFTLLLVSLVASFQLSTLLIGLLGRVQFNIWIEIFGVKVHLVAGLFFPLLGAVALLYLLIDSRESTRSLSVVLLSLLLMTVVVYSIRTETEEMVAFDPETMQFLAITTLFIGIAAFCWKHPTTVTPNIRLIRRIVFFPSGIMWLSALTAELLILLRWQYEGVFAERITYMVLGGAGFSDILVAYGLVNMFSAVFFSTILYFVSLWLGSILIRNVNIAIYFDANYPISWIKHAFSLKIADLSERLHAKIVNAEELRSFMKESIEQKKSHQRLVVFSQDIVPITIAEDYFSTNTLREFLDDGGSILWIGDIPLFKVGAYDQKSKKPLTKPIWESGAPLYILGLAHVYANPKSAVQITNLGYEIGLWRKWSGIRPIVRDKFIQPLACSENLSVRSYVNLPPYRSLLRRFWDFLRRIKLVGPKGIEFSPPAIPEAEKKGERTPESQFHETHLNAWVKNFNPRYPLSGFYRIWDYNPRNISDEMIEEVYKVTKKIGLRLSHQS